MMIKKNLNLFLVIFSFITILVGSFSKYAGIHHIFYLDKINYLLSKDLIYQNDFYFKSLKYEFSSVNPEEVNKILPIGDRVPLISMRRSTVVELIASTISSARALSSSAESSTKCKIFCSEYSFIQLNNIFIIMMFF